jgi:hypothetical protein
VQFTLVQGVNLKFELFAGNSTTGNVLCNKCSADIDVSMQVRTLTSCYSLISDMTLMHALSMVM